jgi:hypothetical protein
MKKNILRLISDGHTLILPASDGSRLICDAKDTFKSGIDYDFIAWGVNKPGIATPAAPIQLHEVIDDGKFVDIFRSLPGKWSQKWLSQNQVIDFCTTLPEWVERGVDTFILIKKDENKPINEKKPKDNLVVVILGINVSGLRVGVSCLDNSGVRDGKCHLRVVSPELTPLAE